jgi:amidohydrolase
VALALGVLAVLAAGPARPVDAEIKGAAEALAASLVATRRDIHMNPELGNREQRTGALVAERLRALGLEVRHPVAKTGVVGVLRGAAPGAGVALRADLDALPIEERNDVPYRSRVPGVKHACGHDAHTAILLGAAEVLSRMRARLRGSVVFLFQPAEEGAPEGEEGGALLMLKEGALDEPKVEAVYGLHMDPFLDSGQLGWSIGPIFASSDRFAIEVRGRKTHGAYPHTGLDPVPVAAELVQALQLVVSRQLDAQQAKVLTIGEIHGGNRFNIIADQVVLRGTLRALDPELRRELRQRLVRTAEGVAAAHGASASVSFHEPGNPATLNHAALTRAALPGLERVFGAGLREVEPQMGAEDFAHFAQHVPGLYVKLGTRNAERGIVAPIHTEDFDVDEAVLPLGVRALATLAWDTLARGR